MNPKVKTRYARIKALINGNKVPNGKKAPNTTPVPGRRRHRYGKKSEKTSTRKEIQTKDDVKKDFLEYIENKQSDSLESAEKLMDYIDENWDAEDIRKAFGTIQLEGMGQASALDPKKDTKEAMKEFVGPNEEEKGVKMAALMKLVQNMEAIKKNEKQTLKKQLSDDGKKLFTEANAGEEMSMRSNPMLPKTATIGGKTRKRRRKKKRRTRKRRRTKKKRKRRRRKRRRTRK